LLVGERRGNGFKDNKQKNADRTTQFHGINSNFIIKKIKLVSETGKKKNINKIQKTEKREN
jgi:hypothetical protein